MGDEIAACSLVFELSLAKTNSDSLTEKRKHAAINKPAESTAFINSHRPDKQKKQLLVHLAKQTVELVEVSGERKLLSLEAMQALLNTPLTLVNVAKASVEVKFADNPSVATSSKSSDFDQFVAAVTATGDHEPSSMKPSAFSSNDGYLTRISARQVSHLPEASHGFHGLDVASSALPLARQELTHASVLHDNHGLSSASPLSNNPNASGALALNTRDNYYPASHEILSTPPQPNGKQREGNVLNDLGIVESESGLLSLAQRDVTLPSCFAEQSPHDLLDEYLTHENPSDLSWQQADVVAMPNVHDGCDAGLRDYAALPYAKTGLGSSLGFGKKLKQWFIHGKNGVKGGVNEK